MKGNLMVRMMTLMIVIGLLLAHATGQTDLLTFNWLWLSAVAALTGLQATFTGWCPSNLIGKLSKTGECCPGNSCSSSTSASSEIAKKTESSSCCGDKTQGQKSNCCSDSEEGLLIKVLGAGCANCTNTVNLIEATAKELEIKVKVIKLEDIAEIASYGVMSTPGVVIDEQVVHTGSIPSKAQVTGWLSKP